MAYSRYGNLPGLLFNQTVPSLQRNTNNPTRKLPPAGIHPTGNVPLPKRSRKLQPPVVMLSTPKPVVQTDVDEDHANRYGADSPKDPHTATGHIDVYSGSSVFAKVIPKVNKLGDVLDRNKDGDESPRDPHKAAGSININGGTSNVPKVIPKVNVLDDVCNKNGGKGDDVLTGGIHSIPKETPIVKDQSMRRCLPARYRAEPWAFLTADDYSDDDTLPDSITIEFDQDSPRGSVQCAFATVGIRLRKFGMYVRRKWRQNSVVLCGGGHVE